jgi:hypothetical protein
MCSRKNKTRSGKNVPTARTNGDDLHRALHWVLNDRIFSDMHLHGNTGWTASSLVRLAVFWVWSPESSLVAAANDAIGCMTRIFGHSAVASYQALTNALNRYSSQLLPILRTRLHGLMKECDDGSFRVGRWLALAVDGSRVKVPRTLQNEQRLCKPRPKAKRRRKSKSPRRSHQANRTKSLTGERTRYHPRDEGPLVWLTMVWHIGERLPWCWKMGPAYSSERHHLLDMLNEQEFPENTLFCADGGYIGYEFWRAIHDRDHHFLIRVGANVRLLKSLAYVRQRNDIVHSWPSRMMVKKQMPLELRLLHFKDARNRDVYLVTNVLKEKLLSRRQAGEIYRQRWGIELQFRSLKQTFCRTKLRSRTPDRAMVELEWSLIGLWMIQLLARKEQVKAHDPGRCTSIAAVLRIVRQVMHHDTAVPKRAECFTKRLAQAVTDKYQRKSKKGSRDYPRQKEHKPIGKPKLEVATNEQKQRLKRYQSLTTAAQKNT